MQFGERFLLSKQLDECLKRYDLHSAHALLSQLFTEILKSVYSQVRGQAPPAVMRDLLELEIEIGADTDDFKTFDIGQMVELYCKGDVIGQMAKQIARGDCLSGALDVESIARYVQGNHHEQMDMAKIQFIHAWMQLLAVESGVVDAGEIDAGKDHRVAIQSDPPPETLPEFGQPYRDPATGMEFVLIPGGTFLMGDTFDVGIDDEKPVHEVTLSPFYMATVPVTQAQWMRLMDQNPSNCVGNDNPVEQVSLADVLAFMKRLNASSPAGLHFDLPTEAQWEYAARSGGSKDLYAGGEDLEAVGWFEDNSQGSSAPVGGKKPNQLGLYDMSGNVWEWCRDIYLADAYKQHAAIDPVCIRGGRDRVIRGGSWHLDAWSARCARRFRFDPELFGPALGFRVVMEIRTKGFEDSRGRGVE